MAYMRRFSLSKSMGSWEWTNRKGVTATMAEHGAHERGLFLFDDLTTIVHWVSEQMHKFYRADIVR